MKKKIALLMGITAALFLCSVGLYIIFKEKCVGKSIDILLYVSQAILAGLITFIGLFITFTGQESQRSADQKSEKLKEICPFFYVTFVRKYGPNHFDNLAFNLVSKNEVNKIMVDCKFINSRNNVALNVTLVNPHDQSKLFFDVADTQKLILCTNKNVNDLLLQYIDIYGNEYSQKIKYIFNDAGKAIFTVEQPKEITNEKNK